ncbi:MAG: 3'-5' exonuclease [Sulfurospirillum sp.]|nr:3'-5' exonuclease [Sulfurospirillum sp.]MBL0703117.1 3'-5' exonuclease [Sulfurospirillum sp.]
MAYNIFFDTETTGVEVEDQIIQIGAIITNTQGQLYKKGIYDELCSSTIPIKLQAMSVHGIREEELEGKKEFIKSDFWSDLNSLNSNENYLIAHNLPFDLGMLEKHGFKNEYKAIDTLKCAMHLYDVKVPHVNAGFGQEDLIEEEILNKNNNIVPNYKLQTFRYKLFSKTAESDEAKKYSVTIKAHDALSDVLILKMFLKELFFKAKERYELKNSEAMDKLVELSSKPVKLKIFLFGKHKGMTYEDVLRSDKGYLEWLLREQDKLGEKCDKNIKYTIMELFK